MKKYRFIFILILISILAFSLNIVISNEKKSENEKRNLVDTRIDNINYWVDAAEKGLIPFNPDVRVKKSIYTGSAIHAISSITEDSPDIAVTDNSSTQSENSVFVDPNNASLLLNSNNSAQNPSGSFYGASNFYSFDAADNWDGDVNGTGEENNGDPSTVIGLNGRWFVNFINEGEGQSCAYSDDRGSTWTVVEIIPYTGALADKNHICIDNNTLSPFEGNLYVAWTNLGGEGDDEIGFAYSHDNGENWNHYSDISSAVNAGSHNQGVNISTGPNGEVYVVWAIYDDWPSDETAIGFARSLDGGVTWEPATRVISNIRGIRDTGTSKAMRVNSFPSATVDNSEKENKGTIYISWANIGIPGINTGDDIDIYLIKSTDEGDNWSEPIRVNQDEAGQGHEHYFPWITCDEATGILSMVFYDDRNVGGEELEVYCANSLDGGETWEDFKVSDVSFTPVPIPGLAGGYFGDYLGITAQDGWVYPTWTDNRSGTAMTYVSPYQTNPLNRPRDLSAELTFETGNVDLKWSYVEGDNFLHFKMYRDGEFIATVNDTVYTDMLPDYGIHYYAVTANYSVGGESGAAKTSFQWGDAHISISSLSISEHLSINEQTTQYIEVSNTGQLDLDYTIANFFYDSSSDEYCYGDGGGNCYISRVEVGDIDNVSGESSYTDYTHLIVPMQVARGYPITVHNGNFIEYDRATCIVDWNGNKEFDEPITVLSGSFTSGPYTGEIVPPNNAKSGLTRLRVRVSYGQGFDPCESEWRGEVEDYSIEVRNWLNIETLSGTISPGNTEMIAVNFNTENIEFGAYEATAIFTSNDPDADTVEVNISLQVSEALVSIVAEQEAVCEGETVNLTATVMGSEGVDYSWYSDPAGQTGETNEIEAVPEVPTWYFVHVTDTASQVLQDSIFIDVYQLPNISLGADTSICSTSTWTLDAGNPDATYLWSTGETTQTIEIAFDGAYGDKVYSVEVTSPENCASSDEIVVNWVNCSGIEEIENNITFNIFPNPANSMITLKLVTAIPKTSEMDIYDQQGKKVYTTKIPAGQELTQLNVSHLESGVYYVQLKTDDKTVTKKLIIK